MRYRPRANDAPQQRRTRRRAHHGGTKAFEHDQPEAHRAGLLVETHDPEHRIRIDLGAGGDRQPRAAEHGLDAPAIVGVDHAHLLRRPRRQRNPHRHGFTMKPILVCAQRLQRMPERVPQVEQGAASLLQLVLRDDGRLDLATAPHDPGQRIEIVIEDCFHLLLEPEQERLVENQAVLDDFGQTRRELPLRQARQRAGVHEHRDGLMERPDHVLRFRVVHGCLAAHRRIDLRQQRGRDLREGDAALVAGRRETGDVADHAAAEGHEAGIAAEPLRHQSVDDRAQRRQVLLLLPIREHQAVLLLGCQGSLQPIQVERCDDFIGDDHHLRGRDAFAHQVAIIDQARPDVDGIAAFAQQYLYGFHVFQPGRISGRPPGPKPGQRRRTGASQSRARATGRRFPAPSLRSSGFPS